MNILSNITKEQFEAIHFLNECTKGKWYFNNETGLVDIDGKFDCTGKGLKDFKGVRFGVVTRHFDCSNNKLTSLVGAPQEIGGWFDCSDNPISGETLKLVWRTMREKKIEYWEALLILNTKIPKSYWSKMIRGHEDKITPEAIKTYAIASRYSL